MLTVFTVTAEAANIAEAVTETITTPTPGLGHSRLGDIAAWGVCLASLLGIG